jgi:hypothetical protein
MKLRRGIVVQVREFLEAHDLPFNLLALRWIAEALYGSGESGYLHSRGRLFECKFANVDGVVVATITRDYQLDTGRGERLPKDVIFGHGPRIAA